MGKAKDLVGGPAKLLKKASGGIIGGLAGKAKNAIGDATHYLNPQHWFKDAMPDMPDAPLMPDYEAIQKAKRRGQSNKFGRTETIMTGGLG